MAYNESFGINKENNGNGKVAAPNIDYGKISKNAKHELHKDDAAQIGYKVGKGLRITSKMVGLAAGGALFTLSAYNIINYSAPNIIGLAIHSDIYGLGEWISFGIPAIGNVACNVLGIRMIAKTGGVLQELKVGEDKKSSKLAKFTGGFAKGIAGIKQGIDNTKEVVGSFGEGVESELPANKGRK